eukprot:365802-Chlamydomonas_euryale.AAC.13
MAETPTRHLRSNATCSRMTKTAGCQGASVGPMHGVCDAATLAAGRVAGWAADWAGGSFACMVTGSCFSVFGGQVGERLKGGQIDGWTQMGLLTDRTHGCVDP